MLWEEFFAGPGLADLIEGVLWAAASPWALLNDCFQFCRYHIGAVASLGLIVTQRLAGYI